MNLKDEQKINAQALEKLQKVSRFDINLFIINPKSDKVEFDTLKGRLDKKVCDAIGTAVEECVKEHEESILVRAQKIMKEVYNIPDNQLKIDL